MNKRKIAEYLAAAAALSMLLTGCYSDESAYLKTLKAAHFVEPADYETIPLEIDPVSVTDEEVEEEIEALLLSNTTTEEVSERTDVQDGDIVNIDVSAYSGGEELEDLALSGYETTIGSGEFIDGFEDGLIGAETGDAVTLELNFPDDYEDEDLAGCDVTYCIVINGIYEEVTPEFTDEFVLSLGIDEATTADEYREYVYEALYDDAQETFDSEVQTLLIEYFVENSEWKKDPPEAMVNRIAEASIEYYEEYAEYYEVEYEEFLISYLGGDEDDPEAFIYEDAEEGAKEMLVFKVISDREGLNPDTSDWNSMCEVYAEYYGYESASEFKKNEDAESLRESMMIDNVLEFLADNVEAVGAPEEDEEETDESDESSEDEETDDDEESPAEEVETEAAPEDEESLEDESKNTAADDSERPQDESETDETDDAQVSDAE